MLPDRGNIDRHGHSLVHTSEKHPADRADVVIVPAVGDRDVLVRGNQAVGRIEVHPPHFRRPDGDPGVRGVRPLQLGLPRGGMG